MNIFNSILPSRVRTNSGEIATTLTLIALFTMMLGSLAGIRSSQDVRNKAAESCSYSATARVIRADGKPLDSSVEINGQSDGLTIVADKSLDKGTNSLGQKGEYAYT
ncbi:MAG: hypothetical protein WBO77_02200, partial [Microgenomates group bacterium]